VLRQAELLRSDGPHAPSTVKRRLSSWGTLHRWKGLEGPFASPSCAPRCGSPCEPVSGRGNARSKRALTRDVLDRLLATCRSDRLADTRDLAILLLAFASGGRRRSEVARLRVEQISDEPRVPLEPLDPKSPTLPAWRSSSAAPRRVWPTRRAGCFWCGRRSRRCANG
jgi:integrase